MKGVCVCEEWRSVCGECVCVCGGGRGRDMREREWK